MRSFFHGTYKLAKRIVIFVVGMTVVLIGAVMFFTPGPALLVIPAGLAILSIEFAWARRWLKTLKEKTQAALNNNKKKPDAKEDTGNADQND